MSLRVWKDNWLGEVTAAIMSLLSWEDRWLGMVAAAVIFLPAGEDSWVRILSDSWARIARIRQKTVFILLC